MSCSVAKSRIIFDKVAVAMSLFGVKWLGTSAIFDRSQTFVAPLIFRNSVIATAAESSFAMTRSSSIEMMSPGATELLPAWAARIFSVMVIGRAIAKPPHGSRCRPADGRRLNQGASGLSSARERREPVHLPAYDVTSKYSFCVLLSDEHITSNSSNHFGPTASVDCVATNQEPVWPHVRPLM